MAARKMIDITDAAAGTPLADAEVRVVELDLDAPWEFLVPETLLSASERERAGRFIPDESRRRYVARRAALRVLLGGMLDLPPSRITLSEGPRGKPSLSGPPGARIEFNISHSGPRALIAFAMLRRVGVDIERVRELPEAEQLVERFFAPQERAQFSALTADLRRRAFFATWTRKEAVAKATGRGIADTLQRFAVTVDPRATPELLSVDWPGGDVQGWQLFDLPVADGFAGALAVEGEGCEVGFVSWRPAHLHPLS